MRTLQEGLINRGVLIGILFIAIAVLVKTNCIWLLLLVKVWLVVYYHFEVRKVAVCMKLQTVVCLVYGVLIYRK